MNEFRLDSSPLAPLTSSPFSSLVCPLDQSIMEYNGGDIIAMAGKNCVAIAS